VWLSWYFDIYQRTIYPDLSLSQIWHSFWNIETITILSFLGALNFWCDLSYASPKPSEFTYYCYAIQPETKGDWRIPLYFAIILSVSRVSFHLRLSKKSKWGILSILICCKISHLRALKNLKIMGFSVFRQSLYDTWRFRPSKTFQFQIKWLVWQDNGSLIVIYILGQRIFFRLPSQYFKIEGFNWDDCFQSLNLSISPSGIGFPHGNSSRAAIPQSRFIRVRTGPLFLYMHPPCDILSFLKY